MYIFPPAVLYKIQTQSVSGDMGWSQIDEHRIRLEFDSNAKLAFVIFHVTFMVIVPDGGTKEIDRDIKFNTNTMNRYSIIIKFDDIPYKAVLVNTTETNDK